MNYSNELVVCYIFSIFFTVYLSIKLLRHFEDKRSFVFYPEITQPLDIFQQINTIEGNGDFVLLKIHHLAFCLLVLSYPTL